MIDLMNSLKQIWVRDKYYPSSYKQPIKRSETTYEESKQFKTFDKW